MYQMIVVDDEAELREGISKLFPLGELKYSGDRNL